MGAHNFQSYIVDERNNISLKKRKCEIEREKYINIRKNSYVNKQENGDLVLVIDALIPFNLIGKKLNYFPFDYKQFIKKFKKV